MGHVLGHEFPSWILDVGIFLPLNSFWAQRTGSKGSTFALRMHTACLRSYSSHVIGLSAKGAFRSTTTGSLHPGLSQTTPLCTPLRTNPLAILKHSIHHLSAGDYPRLRRTATSPHAVRAIARHISWSPRSVESKGLSDEQEDAAKAAILDKVMKGRQPTDLMLRCEPFTLIPRHFA